MVRTAIEEYIKTTNQFPTLDALVAKGLYTFPQDRGLSTDNPISPHYFTVKLFAGDYPLIARTYKIVVTVENNGFWGRLIYKLKGKCAKTFVYHSSDFPRIEWLDEYPEA